jgi:hypothetical protein
VAPEGVTHAQQLVRHVRCHWYSCLGYDQYTSFSPWQSCGVADFELPGAPASDSGHCEHLKPLWHMSTHPGVRCLMCLIHAVAASCDPHCSPLACSYVEWCFNGIRTTCNAVHPVRAWEGLLLVTAASSPRSPCFACTKFSNLCINIAIMVPSPRPPASWSAITSADQSLAPVGTFTSAQQPARCESAPCVSPCAS